MLKLENYSCQRKQLIMICFFKLQMLPFRDSDIAHIPLGTALGCLAIPKELWSCQRSRLESADLAEIP